MESGSVIVPPAQGTYGSIARNMLLGKLFNEWDASFKHWKFKERLSGSRLTTNSSSPVIGSGSLRELQLGLKNGKRYLGLDKEVLT